MPSFSLTANVVDVHAGRVFPGTVVVENGKRWPFKFHFGAPSCVPATAFETSGAMLTAVDIRRMIADFGLGYLSEVMNYPGVLNGQPDVLAKLEVAKSLGLPVDGHAP